jgi:hypothetical protein
VPVRDLGPRRRWLYIAMLVPMAAGGVVMAASTGSAILVGGLVAAGVVVFLGIRSVLPGVKRGTDHAVPSDRRSASQPGDATARLAAILERLDRLSTDELRLLAVRPLDPVAHGAARSRAVDAARRSGRAAMVDEAATGIAAWLDQAFGSRSFDPTLVGLAWRHEPQRPEDRERLRETLADAVLAVAVEDLVDEATYGELLGPCATLTGDDARSRSHDDTPG